MVSRFHSIRFKIFISLCLLTILSTAIIIFINDKYVLSTLTKYEFDTAVSTSNETKKSIEYMLDLIQNTSDLLCTNDDIINSLDTKVVTYIDIDAQQNMINTMLTNAADIQPNILGIYVVGSNGKVFSSLPEQTYYDVLIKKVNLARTSNEFSGVYRDNTQDKDIITYSTKIYSGSKRDVGTLIIDIDYNKMQETFSTTSVTNDEKILVIDQNGDTLFNSPNYISLDSIIAENPEILERQELQLEKEVFGLPCIIVSSSIEQTNWKIIRIITKEKVYEDTNKLRLIIFSIAFVFVVIAFVISILLSTILTRPLNELRGKIKHVENGNFDINVSVNSKDELGQLSHSFDNMVDKIKDYMDKELESQKMKSEMKFQMLQNQINPHFLYNTLDSVKWLATIQNVHNISEMTTSLINLLRYNLNDTDKLTPLSEEIESIKNYITIQKYRYGNMFSVVYDIPPELLQSKILRFILQPIVENAIYHGFDNLDNEGEITISVHRETDSLVISINDNGTGPGEDNIGENISYTKSDKFNGIGLDNIQKRIQLYFSSSYGLALSKGRNGVGTKVTITVPYIE